MATISNTPRPGYVWDSTDNVWYPIGVGAHQHTNAADTPAVMPYSTYAAAGKNKILNGDFNINQRSFTSVTANATYTFDRFKTTIVGDGTCTFTPQTFTTGAAPVSGYEAKNYLQVVTTGQTATSSLTQVTQQIEDVRTFAGQTVTLSFWAKATSGTPYVLGYVVQNFGSGGSPSSEVFTTGTAKTAISTSWARYSFTLSVPSISGKTIGTDANTSALSARIVLSAGSDYNSLIGSFGIQTGTFQIWGVQVEAGSTATAFQTATGNPASELAACQRYYYRTPTGSTLASTYMRHGSGSAFETTRAGIQVQLPVPLRSLPSSVDYSNLALNRDVSTSHIPVTLVAIENAVNGSLVCNPYCTVGSGLTVGTRYELENNGTNSGYIGFNAEL